MNRGRDDVVLGQGDGGKSVSSVLFCIYFKVKLTKLADMIEIGCDKKKKTLPRQLGM